MLWRKRKETAKKQKPPARINCIDCPPNRLCCDCPKTLQQLIRVDPVTKECIKVTDFTTGAEIVQIQRAGKLPANIGRQEGEAEVDERILIEELKLLGFVERTAEFERAMEINHKSFRDEKCTPT